MFGLLPGLINWDRLAMIDNNLANLSVLAHPSDKKPPFAELWQTGVLLDNAK